jgi:hypothetical protein
MVMNYLKFRRCMKENLVSYYDFVSRNWKLISKIWILIINFQIYVRHQFGEGTHKSYASLVTTFLPDDGPHRVEFFGD